MVSRIAGPPQTPFDSERVDRGLYPLPDHIELPLEIILILDIVVPGDKYLSNHRLGVASGLPEMQVVCRHTPPAQDLLPLVLDHPFQHFLLGTALLTIRGEEHHPDTVLSGPGQLDTNSFAGALEEPVGNLHQDPGAIARLGFTAARASVVKVAKHLERLSDDLAGLLTLDVDDETNATRVVFVLWIVQPLFGRQPYRITHYR